MCLINLISRVALIFTLNASRGNADDFTDYIGFGISTGLQTSPISASDVSTITSQLNAKTYRIYGWPSGPSIAEEIISQSNNPNDIQFIIELWDLNSITTTVVDQLISDYSTVEDNVYLINIGNEPLLNPDYMSWDLLSTKLSLVYDHLSTKPSPWNDVKVTIPFSEAIFGNTWPVLDSYFSADLQAELDKILAILDTHSGPFTMNLYPFFTLPCCGDDNDVTEYAIGNEKGWGGHKWYNNMLEAKYDAALVAMEDVYGTNDIELIITETGWSTSSTSKSFATTANAQDYYRNTLISMNNETSPLYQKKIYFFELFDEDLKGNSGVNADWEPYFGIYDIYGTAKSIYADPNCDNGILSNDETVCCSVGCGLCGGTGCSGRPGGASACCHTRITQDAFSCQVNEPPCLM